MTERMKPASLFIGRWAPCHEGHQALIESVLVAGKPVVIAIRDTEPSANNPYSTSERWTMVQEALPSDDEIDVIAEGNAFSPQENASKVFAAIQSRLHDRS